MTRSSSRFTPPSGESGLAEDADCYCETVIRVLVVEDESWLRAALVEAFSSSESLTVAGAFGSLAAVRQAILQGLAFDAALVDLGLPDGSGLSLLPELRAANASAGLLVFTMFDEPETVFAALRAGARRWAGAGQTVVADRWQRILRRRRNRQGKSHRRSQCRQCPIACFVPVPSHF